MHIFIFYNIRYLRDFFFLKNLYCFSLFHSFFFLNTLGHPRFFLGTDSAPHPAHLKECSQSCAGVFTTPLAIPYLATILDSFGAIDKLRGFACEHGKKFYGIKDDENEGYKITLVKQKLSVPKSYHFGNSSDAGVVPFWAGKDIMWKIEIIEKSCD